MTSDELSRAWTHRQILELNFNNRLNFFLLFQSILLAATVNGIGQAYDDYLLIVICMFGTVLTIIWWLVQRREHHMLDTVKNYLREHDKSYRVRRTRYQKFSINFSVNNLLSRVIPPLISLLWLLLIGYVLIQ